MNGQIEEDKARRRHERREDGAEGLVGGWADLAVMAAMMALPNAGMGIVIIVVEMRPK